MHHSLEVTCLNCGYVSYTWDEDARHSELCDAEPTMLPGGGIQ